MSKTRKNVRVGAMAAPKKKSVRPRWSKEEVSVLKKLYRSHSNAEIAKILGRKVSSVVFKGHRLGLSKGIRRLREMGRENIRRRWQPSGKRKTTVRSAVKH